VSLENRIVELREDIAKMEKRRIRQLLWEGDLEGAEDLMIAQQRRALIQAYLDKMDAEEVGDSG